jgi:hypothetical protein
MQPVGTAARWLGRAAALLLLLFWGAFFVEHLVEWFLRPRGAYPPPRVWVAQFLHFAMLAGFAMMLRWELAGAVVMASATVLFFARAGMRGFPWIACVNLLPVVFFAAYWAVARTRSAR